MEKASRATREAGSEAEKLSRQERAFQMLGASTLAMGAAAAAGVGLAVSKWADFDAAMSNVQAATRESEENMQLLSEAALDAGARTVFSAEEAANAIEELAKAGVSTADILGGALDGALDLAAAGGLGVADAAGIAATALKTFGLEGSDMAHVADLLAAGAGKAMGDVTDLSAALNQSAMVANATGLSIEETTAALAAFASQGLLGSDAGTSFKAMLQSLTPTSAAARDTMERLGITAYDAQGNFVGLTEFAGSLQAGLRDLSVEQQQAALKTIFGSDAVRAATVLYSEGADGVQEWIDAVDDQGFAAEQAAARLDNLKGDIEALGGALDTALIKTGSGANDALRAMVQTVTKAIDAYSNLPAPLQGIALWSGVAIGAVGLLGGTALLAVPKIVEFKNALHDINMTGGRFAGVMQGIGKGVGIATTVSAVSLALDAFRSSIEAAQISTEGMENALIATGDAQEIVAQIFAESENWADGAGIKTQKATEQFGAFVEQVSQAPDMRWMGSLGTYLFALDPAADKARDRFEKLGGALASMTADEAIGAMRKLRDEYELTDSQVLKMLDMMPDFKDKLVEQATASGRAADDAVLLELALGRVAGTTDEATISADANANALEVLQGVASDTTDEVKKLADEIRNFGSAQFDVEQATIQFYDALDALNENLASGSASLDVTSEAGRATREAMLESATATNEYAAAVAAAGGSDAEYQAILEQGRQKLIDVATQLGMNEGEAKAYADQLIATPEVIRTWADLNTSVAQAALNTFLWNNDGRTITIRANVQTFADGINASALLRADGGITAYANGGIPSGIYSGGAPLYKFAEPETRWEAFISGKQGQEERNRQIWVEAGRRLGMNPGEATVVQQVPTELVVRDADGALIGRMQVEAARTVGGALAPVSPGEVRDRLGVSR